MSTRLPPPGTIPEGDDYRRHTPYPRRVDVERLASRRDTDVLAGVVLVLALLSPVPAATLYLTSAALSLVLGGDRLAAWRARRGRP